LFERTYRGAEITGLTRQGETELRGVEHRVVGALADRGHQVGGVGYQRYAGSMCPAEPEPVSGGWRRRSGCTWTTGGSWATTYDLDEATPEHSGLSKAGTRFGLPVYPARFAERIRQSARVPEPGWRRVTQRDKG
jgi:hypothetical protein